MPICASICDFGATGSVTYFPMCPVCAMAGGGIHAVCTVVNIISVIGHCGGGNDTETFRANFIVGFYANSGHNKLRDRPTQGEIASPGVLSGYCRSVIVRRGGSKINGLSARLKSGPDTKRR